MLELATDELCSSVVVSLEMMDYQQRVNFIKHCVVWCAALRGIIMDSQLPGEGATRLQEMEEHWRRCEEWKFTSYFFLLGLLPIVSDILIQSSMVVC